MTSPKTILITGATGKIGRNLVRHFLEQGQTVVAMSRSRDNLRTLKADMAGLTGRLEELVADLQSDDPAALIDALTQRRLLPHHVINNARDIANLKLDAHGMPSRAQWSTELIIGVVAPLELAMALTTADSPLESVVNVSSMYGMVAANPSLYDNPPQQSPIHYGVIKAGLLHLTKELAVRLARHGIRVNAVSYGGVEGRTTDEFKARYAKLCPLGRMLREDEVAKAVAFLVSDGASGMTGHNLVVDGGWSIW